MPAIANDTPPPLRLLALAIQHVLVMYAGAVAVPLILGSALKLPRDQVALLINADLFACGIATIIQSLGAGPFGIRLPVMMGVTFASVAPMLAMGANPALGLPGIYGAVIVAGLFGMAAAGFVSRLLPFFPPVVTGSIITVIGITLMRIGINWAGGGFGSHDFGAPGYLGVAALVLAIILLLLRFAHGFLQNVAVLTGIAVGYAITIALGWDNFEGLSSQPVIALVRPFQFGLPRFDVVAAISMCLVMIVVMIESTGMFLALGEMVGRPVGPADLRRGLRADGLGTLIGGIFNTFPYSSFSQNVGLVGVTGIRSPMVCVAGGVVMLVLGVFPRLAYVVASVPQCVLGGAGVVMFGMVAATGIKILSGVSYTGAHRTNQFVVAIAVGFGMIPLVAPLLFRAAPALLKPVLDSGILLATVAAVAMNAYFRPRAAPGEEPAGLAAPAHGMDHI
ncbi:nucleobase:cation symporter-2 family protein [Acidisphaera rubrifaciens]|uniref:Transporter of xanthine/uracil n=1 Tax=Acidisphaera rubrifaciens HS-AP3 TaxID=1231350 RepID=A0A0D6P684_9PROT|nr:nucleobase:cation symporter-2 family protein [Acidisphaera rubrifaciens]GAN76708.1 transporter of xanthine/uracil [Acidisphaera rubrifaciens HS-AP3]